MTHDPTKPARLWDNPKSAEPTRNRNDASPQITRKSLYSGKNDAWQVDGCAWGYVARGPIRSTKAEAEADALARGRPDAQTDREQILHVVRVEWGLPTSDDLDTADIVRGALKAARGERQALRRVLARARESLADLSLDVTDIDHVLTHDRESPTTGENR